MATTSRWKDIDDKFCLCSICLEQLKEPKLLPCLHRYCKDCLNSIIMQGTYDVIKCPECREEIKIPSNGVDGFKTDFYSKNLVEYVTIQQSLKSDEIRECYSCSKRLKVAAYCFKCNDFLCKHCHSFHVTNKIMKDHQKHTLSLEDIETKNISIEKLASMRDAPRCHIHLEEISKLYCETCNNLKVCMTCTYGEHKGHNLHDVKTLAKVKKEELAEQLKGLEEIEKDKKPVTPEQAKENLILNVSSQREKVIKMHDEKDQKITTEIRDIEEKIQQVKQEKQNKEKKLYDSLRREKEKEIEGVTKKYDEILKVKKIEINDSFQARESSLAKELATLLENRERFGQDKIELLKSIEAQLNKNVKIIEAMSDHFENTKKRFETLNLVASSILASVNDWSAVQCIPDMCTAATNLMRDLKKDFPELMTLTNVVVDYKQYFCRKQSVSLIFNHVKKEICFNDPFSFVNGMTSSGDGNIIISGGTLSGCTFILVIDMNCRILKKEILDRKAFGSFLKSKYLSQHRIATVCTPNKIGLYDVRDGSYIKKDITDVISSWPSSRKVRCIATDPVTNHIFVGGCDSRDVYVFDDQLNYLHILTLPEMIKWPQDIIVSDGHLLLCDFEGKKCYETTMEGLDSKLVGEFMKPNLEGNDVGPISVCSDQSGCLYVLWKFYAQFTSDNQCYLVQYNHDGSQVLTTRKLDGNAQVVTVVETSQGDKLLVATYSTLTVYVYDLVTED